MPEDRAEHIAWCKKRALEYCDRDEYMDAVASMGSDLGKHPETAHAGKTLLPLAILYLTQDDREGIRRWIEGFR